MVRCSSKQSLGKGSSTRLVYEEEKMNEFFGVQFLLITTLLNEIELVRIFVGTTKILRAVSKDERGRKLKRIWGDS